MRSRIEKRTIIFAVTFLLASLGIVGGVIIPTLIQIDRTDKQAQELHDYLERKNQRSLNLRQSLKRIRDLEPTLHLFQNRVFKVGDELKLITALEEIATESRVKQTIVSSNLDKITDNKVTITLSVVGAYENTIRYLTLLEKSRYFITIEQLQLSPVPTRGSKQPPSEQISLDLQLSLYALR